MASPWPQINLEGVRWGIYEPDGGFLEARTTCEAVVEGFAAEDGEYKQTGVLAHDLELAMSGLARKWFEAGC
jgi:hypothetical protein